MPSLNNSCAVPGQVLKAYPEYAKSQARVYTELAGYHAVVQSDFADLSEKLRQERLGLEPFQVPSRTPC